MSITQHQYEHDAALRTVVRCGHEAGYGAYADVTHYVTAAVSCSATPPPAAAVNDTSDERLSRGRRRPVETRRLRSVTAQLTC